MQEMIDGQGPNCTHLSVVRAGQGAVQLVVGARYENNCASYFNKSGLLELIKVLKEVADSLG